MANTKENSAGEQQPYIPAGNGEKSGEYTYKTSDSFCLSEGCSRNQLMSTLTKEEFDFTQRYSVYRHGRNLNKAIMENNLSPFGEKMRDAILSAINKHQLKSDTVVYRGIKVPKNIYLQNFYSKYIKKEQIIGSLICSTSRDIKRAIRATSTDDPNFVRIVFEIKLPKGYHALPIEEIASDPSEKEVIISKPRYTIEKIEDWHLGKITFKKIIIKIERNR